MHKASLVACLRIQDGRRVTARVEQFGTTMSELLRLHTWLSEAECTHVAMESTSVYWKPVFNVLEGIFDVVLANAHHIQAVPGRKTDVKDCEWLADLLAHGLIKASFIPPTAIRELRDLTRHRKSVSAIASRRPTVSTSSSRPPISSSVTWSRTSSVYPADPS